MKLKHIKPLLFELAVDPRYPHMFPHQGDCKLFAIHPRSYRVFALSWEGVSRLVSSGLGDPGGSAALDTLLAAGYDVWGNVAGEFGRIEAVNTL